MTKVDFKESVKKFGASVLVVLTCLSCSKPSEKLIALDPPLEKKVQEEGPDANAVYFNPQVDILFVIDDSGSMSSHQINLARNARRFASQFQKFPYLDYHIGVITSSNDKSGKLFDGGGERFIDNSTPDGIDILVENMQPGTNGDYNEMFFDPVAKAFSSANLTGWNKGFYRKDAALVVVLLTDTEDHSRQYDAQEIVTFLAALKNNSLDRILTAGIFIKYPGIEDCAGEREETDRIEEFLRLSNGKTYDLCDTDYGSKLADIGKDLVGRFAKEVKLNLNPCLKSIEVTYNNVPIVKDYKKGWSYDAAKNAVILGSDIELKFVPGATLKVRYLPYDRCD